MYLIGDIGNTEVKICLFNSKKTLIKKITLKTNLITTNYLKKKLNFLNTNKKVVQKALFCSVVPKCYKKIKNFVKYRFKVKSIELKNLNLSKFIQIKANRNQVGSDRISNAIGIVDNKFNYIVVDFGTATTFDIIKKSKYIGGVISPGIQVSNNALSQSASKLKTIKIKKNYNILGRNTEKAMQSGFYWGYVSLINGIISKIIKQKKFKPKIILTGGLANIFSKELKLNAIIDQNLTLNGLYHIGKINVKSK